MKMKAYIGVISIIIAIVILNAINGLAKQVHMLVYIHLENCKRVQLNAVMWGCSE